MAGFLSNFSKLGLGELEDTDLYEEKKDGRVKPEPVKEEDFLLDKVVKCPVCDQDSVQKIMKTGKAKLLSTDMDLRPRYEHVDFSKYEVYQCAYCGYASLAKDFQKISLKQITMIQEGICSKVVLKKYDNPTYSYEQALERHQLALACAMVKRARVSEKAYICLKSAWLMRGYAESLEEQGKTNKIKEVREAERDFLEKAYHGFTKALTEEGFPMCGMNEPTMDYLLAAVALEINRIDDAKRLVSKIMQSSQTNPRAKEKARELKEIILRAEKA